MSLKGKFFGKNELNTRMEEEESNGKEIRRIALDERKKEVLGVKESSSMFEDRAWPVDRGKRRTSGCERSCCR